MAQQMSQVVPAPPPRPLPPGLEKLKLQPVQATQRPNNVVAWDERKDNVATGRDLSENEVLFVMEVALLITLAFVDILLCLVTYFKVDGFHGDLYNIVDLRVVLLPDLDAFLVVWALLGFGFFIALVICVECFKKPWFDKIMGARLGFQVVPCFLMCLILFVNSESNEWSPFAAVITMLCSWIAYFVHLRFHYSHQLPWISKVVVDICWAVASLFAFILICLYAFDGMGGITGSDELGCPFANNDKMPVFSRTVGQWYCAPWGEGAVQIERVAESPARLVTCLDNFLDLFGSSISVHAVICPTSCLSVWTGSPAVTGCEVYSVLTPICVAAIHAGAATEAGGEVKVYGRVGVAMFDQCSRNSIVSEAQFVMEDNVIVDVFHWDGSGDLDAPSVATPGGEILPQGYHFNVGTAREYVQLHGFARLPADEGGVIGDEPWTRIEGSVSLRIAGMELENAVVRLGETDASLVATSECRIRGTGVRCDADPIALLKLDFCVPNVHACPK